MLNGKTALENLQSQRYHGIKLQSLSDFLAQQ
jgi:hypothetical protein